MFLNIILTLLVVILLSITIIMYVWWKKFGKKMFGSMLNMKDLLPKGDGKSPNNLDINQLMSNLTKIKEQFKK